MKRSIYLLLQGRIGNQLFQYALARKIQLENNNSIIYIDDSRVLELGWENSLLKYKLPDVVYMHEDAMKIFPIFSSKKIFRLIYKVLTKFMGYKTKFLTEKLINPILNLFGIFICENGYLNHKFLNNSSVLLDGFFQSEKYFYEYKNEFIDLIRNSTSKLLDKYPNIEKIRNRNTICISIKIEHNIGNSLYNVCTKKYWEEAIQYLLKKIENPLFFICSDNVQYVLDNLIDANKYDYIIQDKKQSVHMSLAAMSECKHFIIGNTTFGWWAQYLSLNKDKIVVAPSKWMAVDMPIDIYQPDWHLIEV